MVPHYQQSKALTPYPEVERSWNSLAFLLSCWAHPLLQEFQVPARLNFLCFSCVLMLSWPQIFIHVLPVRKCRPQKWPRGEEWSGQEILYFGIGKGESREPRERQREGQGLKYPSLGLSMIWLVRILWFMLIGGWGRRRIQARLEAGLWPWEAGPWP
jgi:hypothetical protein